MCLMSKPGIERMFRRCIESGQEELGIVQIEFTGFSNFRSVFNCMGIFREEGAHLLFRPEMSGISLHFRNAFVGDS